MTVSNIFQLGKVELLDYFNAIEFHGLLGFEFDTLCDKLRSDIGSGLSGMSAFELIRAYENAVAKSVGDSTDIPQVAKNILFNTLANLINIRALQCSKKQNHLNEDASIRTWNLENELTSKVVEFVHDLERQGKVKQNGLSVFDYELKKDSKLLEWVQNVYRPTIRAHVDEGMMPVAHVRVVNASRADNFWMPRYEHEYANFHWDSTPYSFPLIVYLDEVGERDGPFSYVDSSDKLSQDYVLRAMHMAVHNFSMLKDGTVDKKLISKLPRVLRQGDRVGFFTGAGPFEEMNVKKVLGSRGTTVLFDGFHLVHDGGFPQQGGSRCSLFVNFRFPKQRLYKHAANLAERWMRFRS